MVATTETTTTPVNENTVEDLNIEVPVSGADFEAIPEGVYPARLVGFRTVDKPDWKLKGEENEDKEQWVWRFEITGGGEYAGVVLQDYTNRSWHPKSKAHKHAAALFGVPELTPDVAVSTGQLAGRACQLWVIEKDIKGTMRNFIDKVTPAPKPRQRQQPQSIQRVNVPDLGAEDEIDF